ncbi:MAG: hypothetical protein GVY30_00695 [Chloroflexi bacterium]|jgi:hypothetical protein|nr:hypothetical protein [Chloroflexota bacterium]
MVRKVLRGAALLFMFLVMSSAVIPAGASTTEYVEIFEGDMPLMFAVGHGGWKQVGELENGGWAADPLLRDYFYQILVVRLYEKTGHLPYIVYQQGNRNYVNTNRPVDYSEAYHPDNLEAQAAYFEFHDQVDAMIARVEAEYGADMALIINPHTTNLDASIGNRPWDRIADIGFVAPVTYLGNSNNTMKALYDRRGEIALRGEDSIPYQFFHGQDWPSSDAVWPAAAVVNAKTEAQTGDDVWHVLPAWVSDWNTDAWVTAYFNGWSTVLYHGTNSSDHHENWTNGLDAFQIEVNYTKGSGIALDESGDYQLNVPFATALMDDLVDAILHSLRVNYGWEPGDAYNVVIDNGDTGFGMTGSWEESRGEGFWGTPSIYSNEVGATAKWRPDLNQSGVYEVLVRWTGYPNRTSSAQYTVNHVDGHQTFSLNQSVQDARWISLGTFLFEEGMSGSVTLTCNDADHTTSADAVMFRLVELDNDIYLPIIVKNIP